MIKYIYVLFLGIMISLFVGIGISTFYPGPKPLAQPELTYADDGTMTKVDRQKDAQFQREQEDFQKTADLYRRNVSMISLVAALIILAISFALDRRLPIITDGALLGGVFTLIYSTGMGVSTSEPRYRFVIVTVAMLVAIFLGYWKFIRTSGKAGAK